MSWLHWALASAFFAGLTAVLAKAGVARIDANVATALRASVIFCFTWAVAMMSSGGARITEINGRSLLFLILSGLASGASWLCYFRALDLGEASKVASVDKLSVVFVVVFAALFLRERVQHETVVGAALIVAGALILSRQTS